MSAAGAGTATWGDLADGVLATGACTGCAGCVLACPRRVLALDREAWIPRLAAEAQAGGDPGRCLYSARGCDLCGRACPRWGTWEEEADRARSGRPRASEEVIGIHRRVVLAAATDPEVAGAGQDGGVASALLIYALETGVIDAALVSGLGPGLHPRPLVARDRAGVLAAAGSRYTFSPHLLAWHEAPADAARLGLVGVGCQVAVPAVAAARGARRLARRFGLTIGLLCNRTFTDGLFTGLLAPRYGLPRETIVRLNIKGRLQIWTGASFAGAPDVEVPLKECDPYARPGCRYCPDFTAAQADISLGGIGRFPRTTLAIVRTGRGADLLDAMAGDGRVTLRDAAAHDPEALALVARMAARQRRRWAALAGEHLGTDPRPGVLPAAPGEVSLPGPPGSAADRP